MSDTMPERVWVDGESKHEEPGVVTSYFCYDEEPPWECVPYVPEQRALDAEREREEIFHALHPECWAYPGIPNSCTVEMCDCFDSSNFAQQISHLRAERDALQSDLKALLPWARRAIVREEVRYILDEEEPPVDLSAARAILSRETP